MCCRGRGGSSGRSGATEARWESIGSNAGLTLVCGLDDTFDIALRETLGGAESDVVGDGFLETCNILHTKITKGSTNDVGRKAEVALSDGKDPRIFVVESGYELYRLTAKVELVVDGTLIKVLSELSFKKNGRLSPSGTQLQTLR